MNCFKVVRCVWNAEPALHKLRAVYMTCIPLTRSAGDPTPLVMPYLFTNLIQAYNSGYSVKSAHNAPISFSNCFSLPFFCNCAVSAPPPMHLPENDSELSAPVH